MFSEINIIFLLIVGSDEGLYAWVIANYALGTLGSDPSQTTGIIELGGASAQVGLIILKFQFITTVWMFRLIVFQAHLSFSFKWSVINRIEAHRKFNCNTNSPSCVFSTFEIIFQFA